MQTTREKLYQEIWNDPVSKVAVKYGVSDQAIRKKCKKLNIPLPSNKYWGNINAGRKPAAAPLPEYDGDNIINFHISYKPEAPPSKAQSMKPILFGFYDKKKREQLSKICSEIIMQEHLKNPHPEIVKHKAIIKETKKKRTYGEIIDIRGLYVGGQAILDTHSTSEQTLPKAYLFLDALMKAIEKAGGKTEVTKEKSYFIIEGEKISFQLKEKYNQVKIPEDRKDRWRSYDLEPSGLLKIVIGYESVRGKNHFHPSHEFLESKAKILNDIIKDIFIFVFEQPQQINNDRIAYKKHLEDERKKELERERLKKLYDNEYAKTETLIKQAKQYEFSGTISRYINHLCDNESSDDYISWAKEKAEWFDPASEHDDLLLDEKDKEALTDSKEKPRRYGYFW